MSIFSSPFPKEGHYRVPSVSVAERVLFAAVVADGTDSIGTDFDGLIQWERVGAEGEGQVELPQIPSGVGVNKLRRPIGKLWERMSQKAKAKFLAKEYHDAVNYLDECLDNMREAFGEDNINGGEIVRLPTGQQLLGKFLNG
jgi:hypothetical protein